MIFREIERGLKKFARDVRNFGQSVADSAARFFGIDPSDPFGGHAAQARIRRDIREAQREAAERSEAATRAANEAAGRIPLSRRQMRIDYNAYLPQYFGQNRITPTLYQPISYRAPQTRMTPVNVVDPTNFRDQIQVWGIIGMGTYSDISTAQAFLVRTPLSAVFSGRSGCSFSAGTTGNLRAQELIILPPNISTNARQADNNDSANALTVRDADLTEWFTIWQNERNGFGPAGANAGINRYRLIVSGEFNSLRDAYPVKLRLVVRARFSNGHTETETDGYIDYSASAHYNTSGSGTRMLDPGYNGRFRFDMVPGGTGSTTYPITSYLHNYLTRVDIRAGSLRQNIRIYNASLFAESRPAHYHDQRFVDRPLPGITHFHLIMIIPGGEQQIDADRLNVIATRRIRRWGGSAYALTADTTAGRLQARNAYAICEHLLHDEWAVPARTWDATTLRRLRDAYPADTFDGTLDPEQTYFEVLRTVLSGTRVEPFVTRGGLRFVRDAYTAPSMLFSEADLTDLEIEYDNTRAVDGIELNYYDDAIEAEATITLGLDGTITESSGTFSFTPGTLPLNPEQLEASGLRGEQRALRFLEQRFLALKYRRSNVSFTVGPEADALNPNDVVYVQQLGEGTAAEITAIVGQEIQLSRPLDAPTVRFRHASGAFSPEYTLAQRGERITIRGGTISNDNLTVGDNTAALIPGETRVLSAATGQLLRIKITRIQGSGSAGGVRLTGFIDDPRAYPENTEGEAVTVAAPTTLTTEFTTALQTLSSWRRTASAVYDGSGEYQLWQNSASAAWAIRRIAADGTTDYARSAANPTLTATQAWAARTTINYT